MLFKCSRVIDNKEENWTGKIVFYSINNYYTEIYVESRSSLHIILGRARYGNYVCIPNFDAGCYLAEFSDIFWNTEKLVNILGEVDGITVAKAIEHLSSRANMRGF